MAAADPRERDCSSCWLALYLAELKAAQSLRAQQDNLTFFQANWCILGACSPVPGFDDLSELLETCSNQAANTQARDMSAGQRVRTYAMLVGRYLGPQLGPT